MSAEMWTIITTGIAILVAIATANRSLRRELSERIDAVENRLSERIDGLSERITTVQRELNDRIDALSERIATVQRELSARIDRLDERITAVQRELSGRIDGLSARIDGLSERISDMRERLGRVEGLLEGLRVTRRKQAGKRHGEESRTPALPPS